MPLSKDIIDATLSSPHGERAYQVVEKLEGVGFDTWWVGGCVRDMLFGKVPEDIDIATSALPKDVTANFAKCDDAGALFGSTFVKVGPYTYHVTTFREDDEVSDGRHPEGVVFGTRMQDSKRRDFTINAMYWHPISLKFDDPFGGEADLKEHLVRFIGDPAIRIKHDALRLLRAVRLRATIAGQYHPETFAALREQAEMVEVLSGARQFEELQKMLMSAHPDRALEDLWELGILGHFLPELHACKGIAQPADYHHEGDVWDHTLKITQSFTSEHGIDVRLAALFHDCGKVKTFSLTRSASSGQDPRIRFDHHASVSADLVEEILNRFQCEARRRDKICWLIRHHMMMGSFQDMSEERKSHWYFHPWFSDLLQVFWLDIAGTEPAGFSLYKKIVQDYQKFLDSHPRPPKPLLSGEDIMEILEIQPGEEVGKILKLLHEKQAVGEITQKVEAREFLQRMSGSIPFPG